MSFGRNSPATAKSSPMIEQVKNPHLGTFAGFPQDHLFSLIKGGSRFVDDYVQAQIDRLVSKDSVCVDVGANLGYVSVYLAKRCRRLWSIEPQPTVFLQLCCNLFLNECFNVTPLNIAATSTTCKLEFAPYQSGWVGTDDFTHYDKIRSIGSISLRQSESGVISGLPLDLAVTGPVDFIKVDAQGADIDVILGAKRILTDYRPHVVWEYEEDLSKINYGRELERDLIPMLGEVRYGIHEIYQGNYLLSPL